MSFFNRHNKTSATTPQNLSDQTPTVLVMPSEQSLISCGDGVERAKNIDGVNPEALNIMVAEIKRILNPVVQANTNLGFSIENEKYLVTLMKSGLITILTKE